MSRKGAKGRAAMTIFERYFFRDLVANLVAVTSVLTLITAGRLLITLFDKVAAGSYPADVVLPLLGLGCLDWIVQMLPFGAMIAALLVLGRYYRDNEIYAAFSIRVSHWRILATLMRVGVPLALLLLYLLMNVLPQARQQFEFIKESGKQRMDVGAVESGRFIETDDGVLFVARRAEDSVAGVFVAVRRDGHWTIETAATGAQRESADGRRWLELQDGRFYEGAPGRGEFVVSSYRKHSVLLPRRVTEWDADDPDMLGFAALWASPLPEHRAELQWRLSVPLSLLLLLLLAEPLSRVAPRRGHLQLAAAIVLFLIYANVLTLLTGMIAAGRAPPLPGVWPAHLAVLALALLLWRRRRPWFARASRPSPGGSTA